MRHLLFISVVIAFAIATSSIDEPQPTYFKRYIDKMPSIGLYNNNARVLSNILANAGISVKSSLNLSMIEVFLSQSITHDISRIEFNSTAFYTEVFANDTFYGPNATNNFILQHMSVGDYLLTDDGEYRFETRNFNTAALDLSHIYGSTNEVHSVLRSYDGGKLLTSDYSITLSPFFTVSYNNLPPSKAVTQLPITTPISSEDSLIFTSGDDRLNENIGLSLSTVAFIREHNYLASVIASQEPYLNDQQIFDKARKINIAQWQNIVLYEYTPTVLGSLANCVRSYRGYDEDADIRTSVEFDMVAFRYGHSTVSNWPLIRSNGSLYTYTIPAGIFGPFPIVSSELPFSGQLGGPLNPPQVFLTAGGIENILRGLSGTKADDSDLIFNNVVRNIFFGGLIGRVVDLFTIDIVRARNGGAPSYYELRKKFYNSRCVEKGVSNLYSSNLCDASKESPSPDPLSCFSLITSNITLASLLRDLYGKVNQIDGLVGVLAEDKYPGSLFSRTLAGIIVKEYEQKRDGDPHWFENDNSLNIDQIKTVKLSHIYRRAFNMPSLKEDLLLV
jgi:peroxidase